MLLATGQLAQAPGRHLSHADSFEQVVAARSARATCTVATQVHHVADRDWEGPVDRGPLRHQRNAASTDHVSTAGHQASLKQVEQGGLSSSVRPDQSCECAWAEVQIDMIDDLTAAVAEADIAGLEAVISGQVVRCQEWWWFTYGGGGPGVAYGWGLSKMIIILNVFLSCLLGSGTALPLSAES